MISLTAMVLVVAAYESGRTVPDIAEHVYSLTRAQLRKVHMKRKNEVVPMPDDEVDIRDVFSEELHKRIPVTTDRDRKEHPLGRIQQLPNPNTR